MVARWAYPDGVIIFIFIKEIADSHASLNSTYGLILPTAISFSTIPLNTFSGHWISSSWIRYFSFLNFLTTALLVSHSITKFS